jgi:ABC-type nitrate/sulfonate/bicarbonate transport system substrate-binding protein
MTRRRNFEFGRTVILTLSGFFFCASLWPSQLPAQSRGSELILAYPGVGGTSTILVAAHRWGFFVKNNLNVQTVLMRSSIANAAMMAGEMSYFAGVGPASVSATLSGMPSRAVWVTGDRLHSNSSPNRHFKTLAELRSKKLGVIGLGGTNHVSLVMALERSGINPKDFTKRRSWTGSLMNMAGSSVSQNRRHFLPSIESALRVSVGLWTKPGYR